MDKLKPCPFCGGKSINVIHSEVKYLGQNENGNKKHIYRAYARCNKCFSRGKPVSFEWISNIPGCKLTLKEHDAAAIETWNRRVDNATD